MLPMLAFNALPARFRPSASVNTWAVARELLEKELT